jgi:hypothetical protein
MLDTVTSRCDLYRLTRAGFEDPNNGLESVVTRTEELVPVFVDFSTPNVYRDSFAGDPVESEQTAGVAEPRQWARLGSNQRPLACEASALPLSYAPGRMGQSSPRFPRRI